MLGKILNCHIAIDSICKMITIRVNINMISVLNWLYLPKVEQTCISHPPHYFYFPWNSWAIAVLIKYWQNKLINLKDCKFLTGFYNMLFVKKNKYHFLTLAKGRKQFDDFPLALGENSQADMAYKSRSTPPFLINQD